MAIVKERILKKFQDEIQQLDRELKTELPREIKRARELGDLRENAEYQAAKERQRLVEARISLLQKRVSEISLMNLDRIPARQGGLRVDGHAARRDGAERRLSAGDAGRRQRRRRVDLDRVADRPRAAEQRRRRRRHREDARTAPSATSKSPSS